MAANDAPAPASARRWPRLAVSAGALTGLLGLFGIAEGIVRATQPDDPSTLEYLDRAVGFLPPCGAQDLLGPREGGAYRIAVVGESSAFYLGRYLKELAQLPGAGMRVASCGQPASGLEDVERRFEEVAAAQPQAVVLVFGHNLEFRYPQNPLLLRLAWLGAHSRLLSLGTHLGTVAEAPAPDAAQAPRSARFAAFLHHAAQVARQRGFQLVVTTMTPNYWMPPQEQLSDALRRGLRDARLTRALGHKEEAKQQLLALAQRLPSRSVEHELAEWLAQDGDNTNARAHLERELAMWPRERAGAATNALIRRIATEEHLLLRDTLRERELAASDGIPGWESVEDRTHLYAALFAREAHAVALLLGRPPAALGPPPPAPQDQMRLQHGHFMEQLRRGPGPSYGFDFDRSATAAYARLLHEAGAPARAQLEEALAQLGAQQPPLDTEAQDRVRLAAAEALWQTGDRAAARRLNDQVRHAARSARAPQAWLQAAAFDLQAADVGSARAALQHVLRLRPEDGEAMSALAHLPF